MGTTLIGFNPSCCDQWWLGIAPWWICSLKQLFRYDAVPGRRKTLADGAATDGLEVHLASTERVAQLRFPISEVGYWSSRYDYPPDSRVSDLVPLVREQGYLTHEQLLVVVNWKAPRSRGLAESAAPELVVDATRIALSTPHEELRIGAPSLVPGVGYPMACVLLHFFHPDAYPIIDYRALWSLSLEQTYSYYTFRAWWRYVEACRRFSREAGVDMRTFDRALWQFSNENQP